MAAMTRRNNADPPRPERVAAFGLGLSAESRAAAYLVAKGYRIVARRFKTPFGEVDIVARRRGVLIFVEVKARSTLDAAAEALQVRQQRRIADAAAFWLSLNPNDVGSDIRFDAVLVAPRKIPRHIQAAFETS
jgi:putative endonuclease